jgi:hypothetical protein
MEDKTNVSDEEIEANIDSNLIEDAETIIEEPNLQNDVDCTLFIRKTLTSKNNWMF